MEQVKLLSMTAVLTVLIWAAADSLVSETVTVTATVEFAPAVADSTMLVEVADGAASCELEISGPRKAVEVVQSQSPLAARLRLSERPTGPTTVTLDPESLERSLAEQIREFRKLTIIAVRPAAVAVSVDRMVTVPAEIMLSRLSMLYDIEPQLARSVVDVQMRESRHAAMTDSGEPVQLDISADVDRLFRDQPEGESMTIPVNLDGRAFGPDAVIDPATVRVTAAIKARRSTEEVPTVPILVAVRFENLDKPYRAVTLDRIPLELIARTITVTGPTEDVSRLVRGETRAFGIIRLKEDDFQELGVTKLVTPEYLLPVGLELGVPPEPVEFKLIDTRDTPGAG